MTSGEVLELCRKARANLFAAKDQKLQKAKEKILAEANKPKWWSRWFKQRQYTMEEALAKDVASTKYGYGFFSEIDFASIYGNRHLERIYDLECSIDGGLDKEMLLDVETVSKLQSWAN